MNQIYFVANTSTPVVTGFPDIRINGATTASSFPSSTRELEQAICECEEVSGQTTGWGGGWDAQQRASPPSHLTPLHPKATLTRGFFPTSAIIYRRGHADVETQYMAPAASHGDQHCHL